MQNDEIELPQMMADLVPNTDYPDEDDFKTPDDTTFIRVRDQDDTVRDIELLSGKLRYKEVELHDRATLKEVRRFLKSENHPLRRTSGWEMASTVCPWASTLRATKMSVTTTTEWNG